MAEATTKKKQSILEFLKEQNICHAVGCNMQTVKLKTIQESSRQWFVVVSVTDREKLEGYRFKLSDGRKDVVEHDLNALDCLEFNQIQEAEYVKVLHNSDGRIYELKNNSFMQKLDNEG